MATKQLLQILLKSREGIKSGAIKVKDVVQEYLTSTGAKTISPEERFTINKEFAELAPSNVIGDIFGDFQGLQKSADDVVDEIKGSNVQKSSEMSDTPFTDKVKKDQGIESLRGDESFGEILEKLGPKEEGIMTIKERFKDSPGIDRREAAEFAKKMREAGIKNEDVKDILINKSTFPGGYLDLQQGKRAATTLARAADMKADTKIKQELLSELDEMKMDKGPRFFQEEFMGYDDFRRAEDAKKIEVNNAIVDDLEAMGVDDDTVMFIMGRAREINRKPFYTSGEDFVDIIKEELDFQGIDYDVEFYKNYFRELTGLMRKPEPRFMYGGMV
jgi:hypothetical protein